MGRSSLPTSLWTLAALVIATYAGLAAEREAVALLSLMPLPDFIVTPMAQQGEARIVHTLIGIIGGFLAFFAAGYLLPGLVDAFRLGVVSWDLSGAYRQQRFQEPGRNPLNETWALYPLFNRLWRDFAETLHPQMSEDGSRVTYRATAPAEIYFNHQVLVDTPMRVEFFRHLPGMLTGAGIVSTFAGILLGLTEFNPMVGPDEVTGQLKNLFVGVSTAFVASFFAIFTAIVVTVVEKLVFQWRYAQVTLLQGRVDDLFRGGVEPEYLAAMAKGSSQEMVQALAPVVQRLEAMLGGMGQVMSPVVARMDQVAQNMGDSLSPVVSRMDQVVQRFDQLQAPQAPDSRLADTLEHLLTAINQGHAQHMSQLENTLKENLVSPLQGISQAVSAILALYEGQRAEGDRGMGARIDQALERGSAIRDGIAQVREELVQQGERNAALSERSTNLMVHEITRALREMTEAARESAQERDAFLLARLAASQGELAERVKENLDQGLAAGLQSPVQTILDRVESVRDDQKTLHRNLTDAILEAFAHHLRTSVERLVGQMEVLGNRLTEERQAMEASFDRLAASLLTAAREGGEALAQQLEKALAVAETRQDSMLEVLARLAAEMRGDINLVAQQVQEAGRQVTSRISEHTLELAVQADETNRQMLAASLASASDDLKQTLRDLAVEQFNQDRQRDQGLIQRLDFASAQIAQHLRETLAATEQNLLQQGEAQTSRLQAGEAAREEQRQSREQALEQERRQREERRETERRQREEHLAASMRESIGGVENQLADRIRQFLMEELQRTTDHLGLRASDAEAQQRAFTREMTDALMAAMASKVENTFGGLANGLNDLRNTFDQDRHSIEQALQTWAEDLSRTTRNGSEALAQQIHQVMNEAEARHRGMMQVFSEFSENLGSRMGRIHDGVMQKSTETISRLDKVESTLQTTHADNARQMTTLAQELEERTRESADVLARHIDEVVTNTSREQAIFIEALSERLDTLRKRLNISK